MKRDRDEFADFHRRFCAKLRLLRQDRGVLQQDVTVRTLGDNVYRLIEQGYRRPSFETLFWLARTFDLRPSQLLDVEHLDPDSARVGHGGPRSRARPAKDSRPRSTNRAARLGPSRNGKTAKRKP